MKSIVASLLLISLLLLSGCHSSLSADHSIAAVSTADVMYYDTPVEFEEAISSARKNRNSVPIPQMAKVSQYHLFSEDALPDEYQLDCISVDQAVVYAWYNSTDGSVLTLMHLSTFYNTSPDEYEKYIDLSYYKESMVVGETEYWHLQETSSHPFCLFWQDDGTMIRITFPLEGPLADPSFEEALQYASVTRVDVK